MTTRSLIATVLLLTLSVTFPSRATASVDHAREAVKRHIQAQPGHRVHGEPEAMPVGDGQFYVIARVSVGRCATATRHAFVFDPPTRRVIPTDESVELPRMMVAARVAVQQHLVAEPGTRVHGQPKVRLIAERTLEVEVQISSGRCGTPVTVRMIYDADSGFISPVGP